jgi:phosphatidylserine/phosphatidylglycerophosphate/cardiolipin synthase-like enzyme
LHPISHENSPDLEEWSFNFTKAAEEKNEENLLIIKSRGSSRGFISITGRGTWSVRRGMRRGIRRVKKNLCNGQNMHYF